MILLIFTLQNSTQHNVKAREIPSGIMNFRNQDIFLYIEFQMIITMKGEKVFFGRDFWDKKTFWTKKIIEK